MIRRKHTIGLRRENPFRDEDVNPNSYITNMADCMLVVMLGLLVALVAHYHVNLDQQITGIQVNMDQNQDGIIDDNYQETGTVYYDENTGTYYMVSE